jgi:hypothetical protein
MSEMQPMSGPRSATDEILHCTMCGHMMHESARACPQCGAPNSVQAWTDISERSRLIALLLCVFLGVAGVHRFYVGKTGTGILWLLTGGLVGVGAIYDLVMIACGDFTDVEGFRVADWDID